MQVLYFEQRDLSALLPAMDVDTSWIGTGEQELCRNLEDAKKALSLEVKEYNGRFTIVNTNYDVTRLSSEVCIVFGEITAQPEDCTLADIHNRLTAVCLRTPNGIKLAHIHMSAPDLDQELGHFYVKRGEAGQRETLRQRVEKTAHELHQRNFQLEALTENIPGGVHQCECDEAMTLLSMSKSFLVLVGYS